MLLLHTETKLGRERKTIKRVQINGIDVRSEKTISIILVKLITFQYLISNGTSIVPRDGNWNIPFIGRLFTLDGKNRVETGEGNPFIPDWNSMVTSIEPFFDQEKLEQILSLLLSLNTYPSPAFNESFRNYFLNILRGSYRICFLLNTIKYISLFICEDFFFYSLPTFWEAYIYIYLIIRIFHVYKLSSRTICLQIYDRVDKCWILSANRRNPPISLLPSFQVLVVFSSRFRSWRIYRCTQLVEQENKWGNLRIKRK